MDTQKIFFYQILNNFISKLYLHDEAIPTVPKLSFYIKLPFFGSQSQKLKTELSKLIEGHFPYINPKIALVNKDKISNFFKYKDRVPKCSDSSVVYKFSCASCHASYVGSTTRNLRCRVEEHAGRSFRTGSALSTRQHSNIYDHVQSCSSTITLDNFEILGRSNPCDLRILESLFIKKIKPILNDMSSAAPLHIVQLIENFYFYIFFYLYFMMDFINFYYF